MSTTIALEGVFVAMIAEVDLVEGAILKIFEIYQFWSAGSCLEGHHAVLASERHALLALLVLKRGLWESG